MMACPVAVEPVNMSLSTCGWLDRRAPTSPSPATAVSTSAGSTLFRTCTSASTLSGVCSEGLTTTVLPIRRAGATCQMVIIMGQFHGRSEEHTSELQSRQYLVCRLLLE